VYTGVAVPGMATDSWPFYMVKAFQERHSEQSGVKDWPIYHVEDFRAQE
jgi:hypothetical protein